jgi:hypothetical protein
MTKSTNFCFGILLEWSSIAPSVNPFFSDASVLSVLELTDRQSFDKVSTWLDNFKSSSAAPDAAVFKSSIVLKLHD